MMVFAWIWSENTRRPAHIRVRDQAIRHFSLGIGHWALAIDNVMRLSMPND
jgi:hypothetical protein